MDDEEGEQEEEQESPKAEGQPLKLSPTRSKGSLQNGSRNGVGRWCP